MKKNSIFEKVKIFYQKRKLLVWIGIPVILIITAVITLVSARQPAAAAENVQYVQVTRGSITESIGEVGNVEAQPSALLAWQSNGVVADFNLKIGDKVTKGDVLMELDPSTWSTESLQAQTSILDAQLTYEKLVNADSDFQTALQTLTDAEWTLRDKQEDRDAWNYGQSSFDRIYAVRANYLAADQKMWVLEAEYDSLRRTLEKDDPVLAEAYAELQAADLERNSYYRALNQILGHPYDLNVETDFNEYDQAKAAVEEARAAYNRLLDKSEQVSAAKANVQAVQNTIDLAKIIAPFDGTVTEISTLPGEMIASGTQAVELDDLTNLVVNVDVSEIDISRVEIGQTVVATFDAIPYKEYSGLVISISSAGTDDSGSVTFRVTVAINNADESVKPGFTAVVSIVTSQADDVLLVPSQAVRGNNGNFTLIVVGEDGTPIPLMVEVGASSDEFTEIVSGEIKEGDQIMVLTNLTTNGFGGGGFGMMGGMRQITGGGGRSPDAP